jgi:hypothetical protein
MVPLFGSIITGLTSSIADAYKSNRAIGKWLAEYLVWDKRGKQYCIFWWVYFYSFYPLSAFKLYAEKAFRMLVLASMLIAVIIFNHKAESPTYIIAITGVGIWYFAGPASRWRSFLLFFALIFSSLSSTDFFPAYVRSHFLFSPI